MQNKGSLHNKFESFGAQPSEKLWDSIASNLDQKKKRRVIFFWWLGSGLAASIVVLFSITFVQNSNTINHTEKIGESDNHIENQSHVNEGMGKENDKKLSITENTVTNNSTSQTNFNTQKVEKTFGPNIHNMVPKNDKIKIANDGENKPDIQTYQTPKLIVKNMEVKKLNFSLLKLINESRNTLLGVNDLTIPKTKKSTWAYSFNIQSQYGFDKKEEQTVGVTSNIQSTFDVENSGLIQSNYVKSQRPLMLRFGIAKQLTKRLSFQTGIDLGWMQTNGFSTKSSLFTIGVPLKLNLILIERKRGAFYSDFGLVNEIPIVEVTRYFNGGNYSSTTTKFISGFMGGTELGLGYNYKINENLKFNLNSGFKWYYLQKVKNANPIASQNVFLTFNAGVVWNY